MTRRLAIARAIHEREPCHGNQYRLERAEAAYVRVWRREVAE